MEIRWFVNIESSDFEKNCQKYVAETYDRKESLHYFQTNYSHEYNNYGPSSLDGIALCDSSIAFKDMIKENIDLHLLTTKVITSLTRHQRDEYSLQC